MHDLLIRGATVVTPQGPRRLDLGVQDGHIAELSAEGGPARAELDASGLHLFPGAVDLHTHFNEPGRAEWEGLSSGSRALAAGGGTTFGDMPLNSDPPLLTARDFTAKHEAAARLARADFALWGGLTPLNLSELDELAACGVLGLKAFMSGSGIPEFPAADPDTLQRGMRRAAQLGLTVAVHAESDELTARLAAELDRPGAGWAEYLASRPVEAELQALRLALSLARDTGCALHVVHVSSGEGAALIAEARAAGVNVSAETCPHYLAFTGADMERLGALLKCAPPLRSEANRRALWAALASGQLQTVGSDHSPSSPELKLGGNPFALWGGIAGVQQTLAVLLSGADGGGSGLPPERVAEVCAAAPARRFGLAGKGELRVGMDADLALVQLDTCSEVTLEAQQQRWPGTNPYLGRTLGARIAATFLRGQQVWDGERVLEGVRGQLVRPEMGSRA